MNFKEWSEKYCPDENEETLAKMSHAWAAGHFNMAAAGSPTTGEVFDIVMLAWRGGYAVGKGVLTDQAAVDERKTVLAKTAVLADKIASQQSIEMNTPRDCMAISHCKSIRRHGFPICDGCPGRLLT